MQTQVLPRAGLSGPGGPGGRGRPPGPAGVLVAGAHGGAGTSTLAALLRIAVRDGGGDPPPVRELPACPDGDPHYIAGRAALPAGAGRGQLIVVARGTAEGARRAVIAVTVLEYLGLRPAALAVVADGAGPQPRMAAQRLALLDDRAGPVVHVPFAAALRAGAATGSRLPAGLRRAVAELAAVSAGGRRAGGRP